MEQIITKFDGIAPRFEPNLKDGYAMTAENIDLSNGKIRPLAAHLLDTADTNLYNSLKYFNSAWQRGNDKYYCEWKINTLDLLFYLTSGVLKKLIGATEANLGQTRLIAPTIGSLTSKTDLTDGVTWKWTASGSGTNEYYCEAIGGGNPYLVDPDEIRINAVKAVKKALGSLSVGTWGYGDNDVLGFNTIYVRIAGGVDPDTMLPDYIVHVLTDGVKTNIRSAVYKWTVSSHGANEYYCELSAGGDPSLVDPDEVRINSLTVTKGTVGKLVAGYWGYGDTDSLGYDTVYVRLAGGGDPDGEALGYVEHILLPVLSGTYNYLVTTTRSVNGHVDESGPSAPSVDLVVTNEKIGVVRPDLSSTIIPASSNPNLITNGLFPATINDWTDVSDAGGVGNNYFQWNAGSGGHVRMKNYRPLLITYGGKGQQAIPTVVGREYTLTFDVAAQQLTLSIGTTSEGVDILDHEVEIIGSHSVVFTALTTTTYLLFAATSTATPSELDNVACYLTTVPTWSIPSGAFADTDVTKWTIYRLNITTGEYQFVADITMPTGGYIDNIPDTDLGDAITTWYTSDLGNEIIFDVPPTGLEGIIQEPHSAMLFAWKGCTLYWSEPGYPDAWPSFYSMNFSADIKRVFAFAGVVAVLTETGPFRVDGTNPESLTQSKVLGKEPCVAVAGCVTSKGVAYLSDSGIVLFNLIDTTVISDSNFTEQWFKDNVTAVGAHLVENDSILRLFHSGGVLVVDGRTDPAIWTTLDLVAYASTVREDLGEVYVIDSAGIKKLHGAATDLTWTWESGDLLMKTPEEKEFRPTEVMGSGAVTLSLYLDAVLKASKTLDFTSVRGRSLGILEHERGRALRVTLTGTGDVSEVTVRAGNE